MIDDRRTSVHPIGGIPGRGIRRMEAELHAIWIPEERRGLAAAAAAVRPRKVRKVCELEVDGAALESVASGIRRRTHRNNSGMGTRFESLNKM